MNATTPNGKQPLATATPRWLGLAWKAIAVAGLGILVYGVSASLDPNVLTAGFETYTDATWDGFAASNGQAADFILMGFRLLGVFNFAMGFTLIAITVMAFRHAERWAWWALLVGNTLAIGGPIVYDQAVGYIGPYEVLEYVGLFLVYVALAATASMLRRHRVAPAEDAREIVRVTP